MSDQVGSVAPSRDSLPELLARHSALAAEVAEHNIQVIIRRQRGADWSAAENQYRNAISEAQAAEAAQ